ncbi:MAG: rhodanese-like domain-containing protein [Rhodothermales bacterium]|nr:rhodanese-like domain-containing protein [Rhodothermales bacterium]
MIQRFCTALAVLLGATSAGCAQSDEGSLSWQAVGALVEREFPGVESISTDSLAAWLERPSPPLLLDARQPEEYAVSHLPGAVRVDPDAPAEALADALGGMDRDRPVVVYCAVGYRSAGVAERLEEAGFADVQNLAGSIFQWANEGRVVVRDGEPVREVHPYDATWGRLLDGELHPE